MVGPDISADLTEGSSEKSNLQGKVWLSGQLTDEASFRDVLEMVSGMNDSRFGLLRIHSKTIRGYVGIEDGKVIVGAHVPSTADCGLPALRSLFAVSKAIFSVMAMPELPAELRQELTINIADLLASAPQVPEALEVFAKAHPQLFVVAESAQTAASSGGRELAQFESYMAWGTDESTTALPTNLSKITSSLLKPRKDQLEASRAVAQQEAERIKQAEQLANPAPPNFILQSQQTPPTAFTPPPVVPQQEYAAPAAQPAAPAETAQPEGIPPNPNASQTKLRKLTGAGSLPEGYNRDDPQSVSQKLKALREDQIASQKIKITEGDYFDESDGPIAVLTPAQRRKRELISVASGLAGLLLFFALGQQVFNFTQGTAKYHSGIQALQAGDYARAQVELTSSVKLGGAGPDAFLYRSVAENRMGHKDKAVSDLNQIIAKDPNNRLARIGRATFYLKNNDVENSIADCNAVLQANEMFPDALRVRALCYVTSKKWKEALDDASDYLRITENDKDARRGRGEIFAARAYAYLKVKKPEQAVEDYTKAIELVPTNSHFYSSRSIAYTKVKEWAHALADANQAIKLDPSNSALYKLRGLCYEQAGDAARAVSDMDTAAKMKPTLNAIRLRGDARMMAKEFEGALEDFEYLLSVDPNDKDAKIKFDQAKKGLELQYTPESALKKAAEKKGH